MQTLGAFLEESVRRYGPRAALVTRPRYRTEIWNYDQLWSETGRIAIWLQGQGLQKGDRIVLWAPNSPLWVACFFAAARLGLIVVPLDIRSGADFVEGVLSQTEPALALLSALTVPEWTSPVPGVPIEDLAGLEDRDPPSLPRIDPDDVAEVLFTSGTTGAPKGVILTHRNIVSDAESVNQVIPDLPYIRLLSILPLSHMFEQTVGLLLPLGRGASIFYPSGRQSTVLFRALQEQRITNVLTVPQALQLFMDAIEREVRKQGSRRRWEWSQRLAGKLPRAGRRALFHQVHRQLGGSLEFFVSGGAPLEHDLERRWELLGIPIVQGYGATETSPVITATALDQPRPGSVGRAIPGVEVKIGPDGEVLVHGPNVTAGYWRNPAATAAAFEDGWYRTGDLGELDADGYLYLRGRKKNLIVLPNGQNVFPEDIERVLAPLPGVEEAVVLGVPDANGTQVHAVLRLADGTESPDALIRRANAQLAPHQQIRGVTAWPDQDFPRTHTLKVKRAEVLARIDELRREPARSASPAPGPADGGSSLARLIADVTELPPARVTAAAMLGDDIGLDSLGRVELLAAIEADMGIYLDEALIGPSTTVGDLEALIQSQQGSARPEFPSWPRSRAVQLARRRLQAASFSLLDRVAPARISDREVLQGVMPPALFVANHTSHLDTLTILRALPWSWRERVTVAAAADYFFSRRWLALLVSILLNAFPFSRTSAVRPTLEHCAVLLDEGWSILLYPEGTRSTSGQMGEFKSGVGLLAVELQVPVVPIHLGGLERVLPKGRTIPHRAGVTVRFGQPLRFGPETAYEAAAARIEEAVRALVLQPALEDVRR
jgi:long-chain acyl-CoA synthetase